MDGDRREPKPSSKSRGQRKRALAPRAQTPADLLAAFFFSGIVFLIAGAVTAVLGASELAGNDWRWIALHLILLGGVSQFVLGAAQFFSTAYLATEPPSRGLIQLQIGIWAIATICVAASYPADLTVLTEFGGVLAICVLALFAYSLRELERASLQKAVWTIRWYYACAAFLGVGVVIGIVMARGGAWSYGSLLGAHLALNLAGWLGTAIVGTLHTFYPSLTNSRLRYQRLQGPTFVAWVIGVCALTGGEAFELVEISLLGWTALMLAAVMLFVNLVGTALDGVGPPTLAAKLVGTAQFFLLAGLTLAIVMLAVEGSSAALVGPWRAALATLLMAGWIGMTVAGSLLHLMAVLARVRDFGNKMPEPSRRDDLLIGLLAAGVAALALSQVSGLAGLQTPAAIVTIFAAAPLAVRILLLATKAGPRQVGDRRLT